MSALVLSILLVVLMFGAVLWVVDGEQEKPTSGPAAFRQPPTSTPPERVSTRRRQPATSRRRLPVAEPAVVALPQAVPSPARTGTVRPAGPPLPRHRARSSLLLVLLVVFVGLLVAVVIGAIVSALAFALRAAVTS